MEESDVIAEASMSNSEERANSSSMGQITGATRRRIRIGFGLCGVALGVVLSYVVLSGAVLLIANPTGVEFEDQATGNGPWSLAAEAVASTLLLAGVVVLYPVPLGSRARWAAVLLLAMSGADMAFLALRAVGGDARTLVLSELLGFALGWIELWMIAVISAEAAEIIERPDLTYQTEVVGNLVIWGAFAWLLFMAWTFDIAQLSDPIAGRPSTDGFAGLLLFATMVLNLVVIARTSLFCIGLVNAYAPTSDRIPS
jgi:hypothetical protein